MIYGRFRAKKKRYQNPSKSLKRLHSILRIGHSLKAVNIDPQAHILCSHSSLKTGGYLLRHEFFEHSSSMPKRRTPPRKSHWGVPLTIRLKPSSFILNPSIKSLWCNGWHFLAVDLFVKAYVNMAWWTFMFWAGTLHLLWPMCDADLMNTAI